MNIALAVMKLLPVSRSGTNTVLCPSKYPPGSLGASSQVGECHCLGGQSQVMLASVGNKSLVNKHVKWYLKV